MASHPIPDPTATPFDADEPLGFGVLPSSPTAREVGFEYTSRGDRVPGRLRLPPSGAGPFPLVLLAEGPLDAAAPARPVAEELAVAWAGRGAAVARIDLPLLGARASAKLSERLVALVADRARLQALDAELWLSFVRQSRSDLGRALDGLLALEAVDAERAAFVGFGLGAVVGAIFCAGERRLRAAALAGAGGGFGPEAGDPARHAAAIACPVLFANARRDPQLPVASAQALHDACPEAGELLWSDGADLAEAELDAIHAFLSARLGPWAERARLGP